VSGVDAWMLALLFGIHPSTVSRYFVTWLSVLRDVLRAEMPSPSRDQIDACMPPSFKQFDDHISTIIDTTNINTEVPSDKQAQRALWSEYHHHTGVKFLLGISPVGSVTFCSRGFPARITDPDITAASDFVSYLHPGDKVMADKGFFIQYLLDSQLCELVVPKRRKKKVLNFTPEELEFHTNIATLRIHIERAIQRVKTFGFLRDNFPISQLDLLSNAFEVCALLTNFMTPLVK